jgi:hypothetical protein
MNQPHTQQADMFERLVRGLRQGLVGRGLRAFHVDQRGSTLTEFVIVLPIFVLIFNGVMILGEFTRKGSEAPIRAYKETFDQALVFQKDFFTADWNLQPSLAAVDAADQLAGTAVLGSGTSPAHNTSTAVEITSNVTEGAAYAGMGFRGTMGESYARAETIAVVPGTKLYGREGAGPAWPSDSIRLDGTGEEDRLTSDLKDLVGESKYAFAMLNDGVSPSSFSSSGGSAFSTLNSLITAAGIRPAFGAGLRYGTVSARHKEDFSFAGRTISIDAHFSTLVPPGTTGDSSCPVFGQGPRCDAARATTVSRLTMEGHEQYKDLMGIQFSNPLDSVNENVDPYP